MDEAVIHGPISERAARSIVQHHPGPVCCPGITELSEEVACQPPPAGGCGDRRDEV